MDGRDFRRHPFGLESGNEDVGMKNSLSPSTTLTLISYWNQEHIICNQPTNIGWLLID